MGYGKDAPAPVIFCACATPAANPNNARTAKTFFTICSLSHETTQEYCPRRMLRAVEYTTVGPRHLTTPKAPVQNHADPLPNQRSELLLAATTCLRSRSLDARLLPILPC